MLFSVGGVKRKGKIFEAGIYPDKDFTFTPEDMSEAIKNTNLPIPIVFAHLDAKNIKTVFDGKLGYITHLYPSPDNTQLFGVSEWPSWVEEALEGEEKKVSVRINAKTKAIENVSLELNPRVKTAALSERLFAEFSKQEEEKGMELTLEGIKNAFSEALAGWKPPTPEPQKKEEEKPVPAVNFSESDEYKKMLSEQETITAQLKASQEESERLRDERIREKAVTFADDQKKAGKLVATADKDLDKVHADLVRQAERAIRDDMADVANAVTFSDDNPSRFSMLKSTFDGIVPVGGDHDLISQGSALFNNDKKEFSQERVDRILEADSLGRASKDKGGK